MVMLPERQSAQPDLGVRQAPGTSPRSPGPPARAPPPPGWGWSPSRSGGWHKLAPAVQIQPV